MLATLDKQFHFSLSFTFLSLFSNDYDCEPFVLHKRAFHCVAYIIFFLILVKKGQVFTSMDMLATQDKQVYQISAICVSFFIICKSMKAFLHLFYSHECIPSSCDLDLVPKYSSFSYEHAHGAWHAHGAGQT